MRRKQKTEKSTAMFVSCLTAILLRRLRSSSKRRSGESSSQSRSKLVVRVEVFVKEEREIDSVKESGDGLFILHDGGSRGGK